MSDYLFDGEGAPDAEVERLERLLAPLALGELKPLELPAQPAPPRATRRRPILIAAAMLAAAAAVVIFLRRPGRWIETGATSVELQVTSIGTVVLEPETRARLVGEHVELARGAVSARIHAPPRRFVVETRFLKVIDLGCAFRVSVDDSGRGRVNVTEGRVALSGADGRELVLAAGEERGFDDRGAVVVELPKSERPSAEPPKAEPPKTEPSTTEPIRIEAPKTKPILRPARPHVAPQQNSTPAQPKTTRPLLPSKSAPDPRFSHDSLKDLDRELP